MMTEDEAIGMYIGMAVGDAVGAPFEFTDGVGDWRDVDMTYGGVHACVTGEWTDDTAMARCISDVYFKNETLDAEMLYENFSKWMYKGHFGTRDYCFDIGNTCAKAITLWEVAGRKGIHGITDPDSQANGGIMRLAPVVIRNHKDFNMATHDALLQSQTTHASATCLFIASMLARDLFYGDILDEHRELAVKHKVKNSGWVVDTYYSAWQSVLCTDNFEDAIKWSVQYGGDSDTVAAVTGMIAGRIYGLDAIPSRWRVALVDYEKLYGEADLLYFQGHRDKEYDFE